METSICDLKNAAVPLSEVAARYTRLRRSGGRLTGLCPFHSEGTASFSVYNLNKVQHGTQRFHCFGCGVDGDIITFLARVEGREVRDVIGDLRAQTGLAREASPEAMARVLQVRRVAEAMAAEPLPYVPVVPIPDSAPHLVAPGGRRTAAIMRPRAEPGEAPRITLEVDLLHAYAGYRGEPLGYVVRTPKRANSNKITPFVFWGRDVRLHTGEVCEGWSFGSLPLPLPIYGAQRVGEAVELGRPLRYLVVEGERCVDEAVRALCAAGDWIPVSWIGGAGHWAATDWSLIAEGEEIALWPDNDQGGRSHMRALGNHLAQLGAEHIRWVDAPRDRRPKWDVADAIQEDGWGPARLREFVSAAPEFAPDSEAPPMPQVEPIPPAPAPGSGAAKPSTPAEAFASIADRFTWGTMAEQSPPQLEFILPGLLRKTVGLMVGPGGTGKSWLMLQTMASIALGRDIWGLWGPEFTPLQFQGRCVYVAAEDPPEIVQWRSHYLAASAEAIAERYGMNRRHVRDAISGQLNILPLYGRGALNQFAIRAGRLEVEIVGGPLYKNLCTYGAGALVTGLDTWGRVTTQLDEREGVDMGGAIGVGESLTVTTGSTLLIAHHVTKSAAQNGQGSLQQAASGSRKLSDHVRWQCNLSGMETEAGKARGFDDRERRRWVNSVSSKLNYSENEGEIWLRRGDYGILAGATPDTPGAVSVPWGRGRKRAGADEGIG